MDKPEESHNEGRIDYIKKLINNNIEQSKYIVNKSKENIENIIKSMNVNKEESQRVINDLEKNNADLIKEHVDGKENDMYTTYNIFYSLLIEKWNEMSEPQTAGKRRSSRKKSKRHSRKKSKKHSRKKSKRRRSRRRSRH